MPGQMEHYPHRWATGEVNYTDMKARREQQGFTLIEAILYIAVALGVVLALFGMFQLILQGRARFMAEADGVGYADWAGEQFVAQVERAAGITLPVPGDKSASLEFADGRTMLLTNGTLYFDTKPLTPPSVKVASLSFERTTESDQATMVRMSFTAISSAQGGINNDINNAHEYIFSATMLR
jgi:type II secretory pathway pseudopilin PulG